MNMIQHVNLDLAFFLIDVTSSKIDIALIEVRLLET